MAKSIEDLITDNLLVLEDEVLDKEDEITYEYVLMLNTICELVSDMFNRYGTKGKTQFILSYGDLKKKLTDKELKQFKKIIKGWKLNVTDDTYYNKLDNLLDRKSITRLDYFDLKVEYELEQVEEKKKEKFYDFLKLVYINEFYNLFYVLAKTSGVKVNPPELTQDVDALVRKCWDEVSIATSFKYDREKTLKEISKDFQQGIAAHREVKYINSQIEKRLATSNNRGRVKLRTEANNCYNKSLKQVMKDMGIRQYRYSAILDDRTTEICRSLNGNVYKLSEARVGVNYPPMHHNCRSSVVPTGVMPEIDEGVLITNWKDYISNYAPDMKDKAEPKT